MEGYKPRFQQGDLEAQLQNSPETKKAKGDKTHAQRARELAEAVRNFYVIEERNHANLDLSIDNLLLYIQDAARNDEELGRLAGTLREQHYFSNTIYEQHQEKHNADTKAALVTIGQRMASTLSDIQRRLEALDAAREAAEMDAIQKAKRELT